LVHPNGQHLPLLLARITRKGTKKKTRRKKIGLEVEARFLIFQMPILASQIRQKAAPLPPFFGYPLKKGGLSARRNA
jgi:hypothetical protein